MKVKRLDERDCLVCQNPTRKLLCALCSRRLKPGPFELNTITDALFLGNETILALINAYDRTGHPSTLKPLTDRIMTRLPKNPTLFKPDHNDALIGAIVRQIVTHNPKYAVISQDRQHLPHLELVRYPSRDCSTKTLCLMTH